MASDPKWALLEVPLDGPAKLPESQFIATETYVSGRARSFVLIVAFGRASVAAARYEKARFSVKW